MQLSLPSMRDALVAGFTPQPVLPNYRHQRSTLGRAWKTTAQLVICIAIGLFYGLAWPFLPPQLFLYLTLPILILAMFVIWALPDSDHAPVKLLTRLFFAFILALIFWPNYLAIQLPGLPWMTLRRLIAFPMAGVLLICLSTSAAFRSELARALGAVKPLAWMLGAFVLIQALTLFLSGALFVSLNNVLNYWFSATALFFITAWALQKDDRPQKFVQVLIGMAIVLCVIAALEYWKRGVLWAGHIPSFLQVQDEVINNYLTAQIRDAQYRVVTTFSVSLAFAEYLAIVVPFVIHKVMRARSINAMAIWGAIDVVLLAAIVSTQSRLGILGWLTAHIAYVCLWAFRRWRDNRADIVAPAISLIYPIGALLFTIGMFTIPAIRNRTLGGGSTASSNESRQVQFSMLWPRLKENPFGYGAGQSGEVLQYRLPGGMLTVDSYVISLLLEYGVIGFLLFGGMLVYAMWKMVQIAWRSDLIEGDLALPLACALMIVIEIRLVLSQTDNIPLIYMLLGLAAVIAWRARHATKTVHAQV